MCKTLAPQNSIKPTSWQLLKRFLHFAHASQYSNVALVTHIRTLQILARYDVLLFMEITDAKNKAFPELVKQYNAQVQKDKQFSYVVSERLGRSNNKEQYAYLYR